MEAIINQLRLAAPMFTQTAVLFIFIAAGYTIAKLKLLDSKCVGLLSTVLVYVVLPCSCIKAFIKYFNREYIAEKYNLIIISAVLLVFTAVGMHFLSKLFAKRAYDRTLYEYSLTMPNFNGVGFAIIEGVLGSLGLIDAMVFSIPMMLYTYTYGFAILTKSGISLKKIFNPIMLSVLLGIVLGLTNGLYVIPDSVFVSVPLNVAGSVIDMGAKCLSPLAMLIVGVVISEFEMLKLLKNPRSYIVVALRLVVVPIIFGLILKAVGIVGAAATMAVLLYCMPCGMNTIVYPRLIGEDCGIGASLAILSNILGCITIPIIMMIFGIGA